MAAAVSSCKVCCRANAQRRCAPGGVSIANGYLKYSPSWSGMSGKYIFLENYQRSKNNPE
jgi:hypothetical protein